MKIAMSSGHERLTLSGRLRVGMSCMKKLNSVGDLTEPCGTQFVYSVPVNVVVCPVIFNVTMSPYQVIDQQFFI